LEPPFFFPSINLIFNLVTLPDAIAIVVIFLLLAISAFISGTEVAYFSLTPSDINSLKEKKSRINLNLLKLINIPQKVLATILISSNFINIGIVLISSYLTESLIDFSKNPRLGFVFQVIFITFILLLFGEILPKVYASQNVVRLASFVTFPLKFLEAIFRPVSFLLIKSTSIINKKSKYIHHRQNISIDDLSHALDLTSNELNDEKQILKGIVKFGNIEAKEIMRPRLDVIAYEVNTDYVKLLKLIVESGYSRVPIYSETLDNIKGILYTKDLIPYLSEKEGFNWQKLIRPPYFVPVTKKINDLLEDFQLKKIHVAIVVDEYGGTSGLVTMEDIMEEIVGEINDEFDEEELFYSKLDDTNYIFEGKILLNDFYKIIHSHNNIFDNIKGDADTLAGLILEMKGEIPRKNVVICHNNFIFKIVSVDNRRIKQIQVTLKENSSDENTTE